MIDPNQTPNLPAALTPAAQFLQSKTMEGAAVRLTPAVPPAPATTEELWAIQADSQTYSDPEGPSLNMHPAEPEEVAEVVETEPVSLYDYESDGVFSSPTTTLLRWIEHGPLIPAGEVKRRYNGDRVEVTFNLQKPSVTARQAQARAKEIAQESEVALKVSGSALLETIKETIEPDEAAIKTAEEAARVAKETTTAIDLVCMQLVTHYSQRENTNSKRDLTAAIHQSHPDILSNPQFRAIMKRFEKDPEGFKQNFIDKEHKAAAIQELPFVPAFHDFVAAHEINIEEVFGGAL